MLRRKNSIQLANVQFLWYNEITHLIYIGIPYFFDKNRKGCNYGKYKL